MHPLDCPHCGQTCLTVWSKNSLGAAAKRPCKACGQFVSVSWISSLAFGLLSSIATVAGGISAAYVLSPIAPGWLVPAVLLGMLAFNAPLLWLHYRFVPLIARAA
jgi:hypothetical protein